MLLFCLVFFFGFIFNMLFIGSVIRTWALVIKERPKQLYW
jgi:hypothetical protein